MEGEGKKFDWSTEYLYFLTLLDRGIDYSRRDIASVKVAWLKRPLERLWKNSKRKWRLDECETRETKVETKDGGSEMFYDKTLYGYNWYLFFFNKNRLNSKDIRYLAIRIAESKKNTSRGGRRARKPIFKAGLYSISERSHVK